MINYKIWDVIIWIHNGVYKLKFIDPKCGKAALFVELQ